MAIKKRKSLQSSHQQVIHSPNALKDSERPKPRAQHSIQVSQMGNRFLLEPAAVPPRAILQEAAIKNQDGKAHIGTPTWDVNILSRLLVSK